MFVDHVSFLKFWKFHMNWAADVAMVHAISWWPQFLWSVDLTLSRLGSKSSEYMWERCGNWHGKNCIAARRRFLDISEKSDGPRKNASETRHYGLSYYADLRAILAEIGSQTRRDTELISVIFQRGVL